MQLGMLPVTLCDQVSGHVWVCLVMFGLVARYALVSSLLGIKTQEMEH